MSPTSLTRYAARDTRQKATNASAVLPATPGWVSTPAAPGAAATRTFLAHCLGRRARTRAPTAGRPDAGAVATAGGVAGSGGAAWASGDAIWEGLDISCAGPPPRTRRGL